ncbi:alpha/beta hydrolase [Streptomyces sp. NBC_01267]|uniref:alpha/beta hydrolase n=1 Tax=Streptomyces sp. NBC_01267 TaxID=2903805 RepID=UPI002E2FBDA1|nr:alpha/beta hydrolase [Streptomyces sp. NBC_01267]
MTRNRRTASLLAAGAAVTLVSALTPATAFAAPRASVATASPRPYTQQKLRWQRCDAQSPTTFRCATVKVPLDYGDPGGKQIDIAISRLKASSAKERRGVLLLNPGGPGGPGLDLPVAPELNIPGAVKRQYDLIGFDPRGVGQSSPLGCGLTADEENDERPYKAGTFTKDVAWARTVADKCRAAAGDELPHLTTRNTARDMDVVRAVLGEKKISYLGYSYGTYLGAVYAQMFPRRTDRFVLDSAADPAQIWRATFQEMAKGAEAAFTRWTEWTAQRHTTYHLGDTPAQVRESFWDLIGRADREPVDSGGTLLTGDGIRSELRPVFFHVRAAAERVAELKKAAGGEQPAAPPGTPEQASGPAPAAFGRTVPPDNDAAIAWAVVCADTRTSWPSDPEQYRRDAIRDKARYPLYGDIASTIKPCAFWKQGSEPGTTVNNDVSALILQNEWDPQTPLPGARGLHRALHGSRMVTVAGGEGHGVYGLADSCADRSATAYLTTGSLPAEDLTCRAPGDT